MSSFISAMQPIFNISTSGSKTAATEKTEASAPFSNLLTNAVNEYDKAEQVSQQDLNDLVSGNTQNLAQIQIDSLKAQAALQTTVQLTSRVVNAYKEIMQMQV